MSRCEVMRCSSRGSMGGVFTQCYGPMGRAFSCQVKDVIFIR